METQLKQLLQVANEVIPELVERYNKDTVEYHELHDELARLTKELEESENRRSELAETIQWQSDLLVKQADALEELKGKHDAVIEYANSQIGGLQAQIQTLKGENAEFKKLNPRKLQTQAKENKAKLAARAKEVSRLEGDLRNERRVSQGLRNRLEEQKIGFWQHGQERVVPFLNGDVIQRKDIVIDASVTIAAWWQHECGLKILCGYDETSDEIYMCNPADENGDMHYPTELARKTMLTHFRKLSKKSK